MLARLFEQLKTAWALSRPFWMSPAARSARLVLGILILLNLGAVYLYVLFNAWNRTFFNALETRDEPAFWQQIIVFGLIAGGIILASVARQYVLQWLQFRWRESLMEYFRDRWLRDATHYRMQVQGIAADNPDQRIADDTRQFAQATLKLAMDLLVNAVTLFSFLGILWALSASFDIPGFLVWVALAYALLGTILTFIVGRPLPGLNFDQERRNADFRFALMRLREHSKAIAVAQGEPAEARVLKRSFLKIARNWRDIMWAQMKLTGFTTLFGQVAAVIPILAIAPWYFAGEMSLGHVFQTSNAFAQVYVAVSWFVNAQNFNAVAEWRATTKRLYGFAEAFAAVKPVPPPPQAGAHLEIKGLSLGLPDGRKLFEGFDATFENGKFTLLTGPSGSGKSTLFAAFAGLWPTAAGEITMPDATHLYLPQKPYVPIGPLAQAACYPSPVRPDEDALADALAEVGLARLAPRLAETDDWPRILSMGEQQRLAIARALIAQPGWLFLDEATSSLDEPAERELYSMLRRKLPRTSVVSIGHRHTLRELHDTVIALPHKSAAS